MHYSDVQAKDTLVNITLLLCEMKHCVWAYDQFHSQLFSLAPWILMVFQIFPAIPRREDDWDGECKQKGHEANTQVPLK